MQILLFGLKIRTGAILFNLCLILSPLLSHAQFITHGPVTGALTHNSARVYVRTKVPMEFTMEYREAFGPEQYHDAFTTAARDNAVIIDLTGLKSNTVYNVKFLFPQKRIAVYDSVTKTTDSINAPLIIDDLFGTFQTFPEPGTPGDYVFVTGSCQESANMKTFKVMPLHKPRMLIHTGDFTYPSYQMTDDYPRKYSAVQESYRRRYQEVNTDIMLRTVPIDYIPDDDDGSGAARTIGLAACKYRIEKIKGRNRVINYFKYDTFPDVFRQNCFRGYMENFPGYEIPDTSEALYHSFVMGNCEFFFVDNRTTADNHMQNFKYDSLKGKWFFKPDSNVRIISVKQMEWLKNGLKNSTADWKFIVCGLPFNQSIKHLIDLGLNTQDIIAGDAGERGTGMRLAASFATYWAGYPYQSQELLHHIKNNNIKDVIVISGDTHHNVMDDGTNAGLPELNASGMAVAGTHLAYYMNKLAKAMGYPHIGKYLWNQGGGGIHNKNFKNQFGKIEVVNKEYVQLSVIDEDNEVVASFKVKHSSQVEQGKIKIPGYQRRLDKNAFKRPTLWVMFAKKMARVIFKQR